LSIGVRKRIFSFITNVLHAPRFEPERVNEYCGL
jgi:hypothetical protein